jgi:8-oxo-dGTP pyrophosphatase MutT (NUDIX family)
VHVVHAHEAAPDPLHASIFLAGPTPRDADTPSWRPEALRLLAARGFTGAVFVPEARDGLWSRDYDGQVEWEEAHLHMADVVLFWVPRELRRMPALTTNDEWGAHKHSGKVVFAAPPGAEKVKYQRYYAEKLHVPTADELGAAVDLALAEIGAGAERRGGERSVPLHVWRTPAFQAWYAALRGAGRRLDGARLEWLCRSGPGRRWLFLWALRVDVHVPEEGRSKRSEVVIGRPDVAAVVMLRRDPAPLRSQVVLVREFRSAVRNPAGMVLELPSGSSLDAALAPVDVAVEEVHEETGLRVDAARLRPVGDRQVAATLLSHHAQVYAVDLRAEELAWLVAHEGVVRGSYPGERTSVQVRTVGELLAGGEVDWSTLGMILAALGPSA